MIHSLKCPTCSAPVDYEDGQEGRTLRCPFCNNTMIVPGAGGGAAGWGPRVSATTVKIDTGAAARVAGRMVVVVGAIVVFSLVLGAAVLYKIFSDTTREKRTIEFRPNDPPKTAAPRNAETPKAPGFASVVDTFGSEGIGPGQFKDARSIALDGEGRIYVGDYTGGRVQVFDSAGKFQTQWMVDPKMPLLDMAADRKGTVYVVQSGKIQRYEGATGRPLGALDAAGDWFNDVTVTADGGLVAASYRGRDDIVRLDPSGRVLKTITAAISGQTDRSELNLRVAVDGSGNLYALGTFNDSVVKYTPDGRFVNRFGGAGGEPGQFRAAQAIAVDNKGRVYVSDIKGVQVFDANGRYLDTFKPEGSAFGMVFNDQNELLVAARTKVVKYTVKP